MPKNLEIKVKLNSHKEIKETLMQNKIKLKEVLHQKDIYYEANTGLLKLRIENKINTLIYYDRNEKSVKRWSDYHIFEFGKTDPNQFLSRFLDIVITVKKKRELYIYKNTRIHLDSVEGLGYFLELEARVVAGLKDAEKRFKYLMDLFDLHCKKEIRASYKDILLSKK